MAPMAPHSSSSSGSHLRQRPRPYWAATRALHGVRACDAIGPACAVSGSWDKTLKMWDVRASAACVGTYAQPDKVLSLCAGGPSSSAASGAPPLLVVATQGRHIALYDLRSPSEPMQERESSVQSQTRTVVQMPSAEGFALGRSTAAPPSNTSIRQRRRRASATRSSRTVRAWAAWTWRSR